MALVKITTDVEVDMSELTDTEIITELRERDSDRLIFATNLNEEQVICLFREAMKKYPLEELQKRLA